MTRGRAGGEKPAEMEEISPRQKRSVTDERPKTREERPRGVGVHGDGAKGMNEHALWADLEEVVEVKEAALVGATSIKPELRRHIDWSFSLLFLFSSLLPRASPQCRRVPVAIGN